jgi:hypothetical protein
MYVSSKMSIVHAIESKPLVHLFVSNDLDRLSSRLLPEIAPACS